MAVTNYRMRAQQISDGAEEWFSGGTPFIADIQAGEDALLLSAELKRFGWHVELADDHMFLVITPGQSD